MNNRYEVEQAMKNYDILTEFIYNYKVEGIV